MKPARGKSFESIPDESTLFEMDGTKVIGVNRLEGVLLVRGDLYAIEYTTPEGPKRFHLGYINHKGPARPHEELLRVYRNKTDFVEAHHQYFTDAHRQAVLDFLHEESKRRLDGQF
jgi:hypothetical protein